MAYILFAEDDTTLRNAIALALKSEGYEIRACKDGAEALAAYAERRPDLMILDVMMPKKSGYDVCAEIRHNDDLLPVVFLTAKSTEEDVVLGLGLGADDFIAKPVRLDVLLARIAVIVKWTKRVGPATAQSDTFTVGAALIDASGFVYDGHLCRKAVIRFCELKRIVVERIVHNVGEGNIVRLTWEVADNLE